MAPQRYERIPVSPSSHDINPTSPPSSPPPSFHSRDSSDDRSTHELSSHQQRPRHTEVNQTLEDTFGTSEHSDFENAGDDGDRERLMRAIASRYPNSQFRRQRHGARGSHVVVEHSTPSSEPLSSIRNPPTSSNDGVFANLNAKPEIGEKLEEQPPSYEQAAADATPPYWENTILAPGIGSDEIYIDGLPVGSVFSFLWNGAISMIFQLVGFLLTYLLHTTHAAKNGSRAGLGITLIGFGYNMRAISQADGHETRYGQPPDPNSHNFDPSAIPGSGKGVAFNDKTYASNHDRHSNVWLSYVLMVAGWFILMKAVVDFIKARRHEQLILQSPTRGLSVAVVGENEEAHQVA